VVEKVGKGGEWWSTARIPVGAAFGEKMSNSSRIAREGREKAARRP
jgi:hypothetical protein